MPLENGLASKGELFAKGEAEAPIQIRGGAARPAGVWRLSSSADVHARWASISLRESSVQAFLFLLISSREPQLWVFGDLLDNYDVDGLAGLQCLIVSGIHDLRPA